MKQEYDFSRAKRSPIASAVKGKTRITIRLDDDILGWFRRVVHAGGGGDYQTSINAALREHVAREDGMLAETLRHVLREEIATYKTTPVSRSRRTAR